jgi:branched-chain amino acid transport system permease protein
MDIGLLAQHIMNGLMVGMMYALVAVGFTLFFGVLDVIQFAHGDVLTVGAFAALMAFAGLHAAGAASRPILLLVMVIGALCAIAVLGMLIARYLVLPLRTAPALNTLLITLMLGTVLRESVRLFYPQGANPKPFPALLPTNSINIGNFNLRLDNVVMLTAGVLVIAGVELLLKRTKLGLAIRAVAQDEETARTMGVNFKTIVLIAFAIGSALAAIAGIMNGFYYNEINFGMGLYLGVIGFAAAIIGGLGSIYGAILGGFLFAALQTIGTVALPFGSAYKDVFAFAVVIIFMAWRPTGLIQEKISERV